LLGEEDRGIFLDLPLLGHDPQLAPQPAKLLTLRRGQPRLRALVNIDLTRPVAQRLRGYPQLSTQLQRVLPLLLSSATASRRNSFEYGPGMNTTPLAKRNAPSAQVSTKAGELQHFKNAALGPIIRPQRFPIA